jgi:carboxyl-terminal processing protease
MCYIPAMIMGLRRFLQFGVFLWAVFMLPDLRSQSASPVVTPEAGDSTDPDSPYENIHVLARAMQLIRQDYVNGAKTSFRDLTYSALRGMLAELDPHSSFMDPRDFKGMQEDTKSEFGGLGVTVTTKNSALTIISVADGTPGFEAGLQPGDQIRKINETSTERMTMGDSVEMLRGEPGEKVTLTVLRPASREVLEFTVARAVIKVPSIYDAMILPAEANSDRKIGYVRMTQFNEPTASELSAALDRLEGEGMEALVLDVRFNPGGLLNSAVDVCSEFLPPNTQVVYTEGRSPNREYFTSKTPGGTREYPLAVLVNNSSASGSEIVAGALKDLGRAIVVGETTFGKGSVQSVVALPDGSAMRFTTAKYFTPGRKPIHEHGVSPDICATMTMDEETVLFQARRKREFPFKETAAGLKAADPQLDRAVDALTGVLMYSDRIETASKSN